ncbi:MAG: cupin domain-containing protein [Verrucomicrobia bacterium]|nr:cupin domain-containing protein [Verrucomicrobiota bacterium]
MLNIKVEALSEKELVERGVYSWPVWEKEVSRFDWSYSEIESCYFLEGKVVVETHEGQVEIGKGDFVTFSQGLSCVWDIKEPVKKHYKLG